MRTIYEETHTPPIMKTDWGLIKSVGGGCSNAARTKLYCKTSRLYPPRSPQTVQPRVPASPSLVPGRGTKYNFCGYPGCEAGEVLLSHQELGGKSGTFNLNSDGNLILISNIEAQQWTREWPKNCICAEAGPILTFFR